MTSEIRVLPSAWVSLVILGPLEPAGAKSQNKTPLSWREAVARAGPRSALPASAMASRTSVVVDVDEDSDASIGSNKSNSDQYRARVMCIV
jgi:hypothetical protein